MAAMSTRFGARFYLNVTKNQLSVTRSVSNVRLIYSCSRKNLLSPLAHDGNDSRFQKHNCLNQSSLLHIAGTRLYSKGKEKSKADKKKKTVHVINEEEISELVNLDRLKSDLQRALDQLKNEYMKNLSLRTSAGSIESLQVEFEGDKYNLQELAQITRKSPQLLVVNVSAFPQAVANVLKAIQDSGMGLNPQQDGTSVFVAIPKITQEHRENMAKSAKIMFHKFKDHTRDVQNKYIKDVKKKEKEVSADLAFSVQQQIYTISEQFTSDGEKMMIAKQSELLQKKD